MSDEIINEISIYNESAVILDGFDAAIIGIYQRKVLVYSESVIIEILCDIMSRTDAIDYFYFNIKPDGAEYWPLFIKTEL
tara:strand:+ start:1394 stop:1633 length:240 start_codon:yes stop_codon:yes gene_type:complete